MTEHLPECPKSGCPACYEQGHSDALDAAREAVAAMNIDLMSYGAVVQQDEALAAIDALREKKQ